MTQASPRPPLLVPFFYGWVIIGVAFVTMAIGVSARTAFSLLLPPLIDEFGWNRGMTAGAFSVGFLVSAALSPMVGHVMDRYGPRPVLLTGVGMLSLGLALAPSISATWQLYATLGVLVGGGANLMSYTAHSQFLPHWFVRRRALAIGIAFSGVGVGGIVLLPWQQSIILHDGWRAACMAMALLVLLIVGPLCLLARGRPGEVGLLPDGGASASAVGRHGLVIIDAAWAGTVWTLARAVRTTRFWWLVVGFSCALFVWYAVQVHQTKYLIEVGFSPGLAAWSLGIVSAVAIPGQISLGALSDRLGREWVWTAACAGFAVCYAALVGLETSASLPLLYVMIVSQGFLGYAATSVMGPIVAEIFDGPHYGTIFGTLTIALITGGAAGPFVTGRIHDLTGSYRLAFLLAIALCAVSAAAIWAAAPRKVRRVSGRASNW